MLDAATVMTFVATQDPDRAKEFYRDKLGLRLVSDERPFAIVFDLNGIMLRIQIVRELAPAQYTALGWQVPDIAAAVQALSKAGVEFLRFPGLNDEDKFAIWQSPSGARIAWFHDPDGNTLSLTQF